MNDEKLNICQVSLARDISLVKENYFNFISFYKNSNFFLICPKNLSVAKKEDMSDTVPK